MCHRVYVSKVSGYLPPSWTSFREEREREREFFGLFEHEGDRGGLCQVLLKNYEFYSDSKMLNFIKSFEGLILCEHIFKGNFSRKYSSSWRQKH